jgi:hypothetical protein
LSEVTTETIEVAGLTAPVERDVRLSLGNSEHVWPEETGSVKVRVEVAPIPQPPEEEPPVPETEDAEQGET